MSDLNICDGIGMLPSGWSVRRIKDAGQLVLGKMLEDKPFAGGVLKPYLKSRNVKWFSPDLESVDEMYFSEFEMRSLRLLPGDLVFTEGGDVGKTSYWQSEDECYIQNSVQKLTCNDSYDPRFVMYVSFLLGHSGYYESIVNHVSIMHLTREKLSRVQLPCPPLATQQAIVAYLDSKAMAIDSKIALLEKKLDAYGRLKASVINRVVTRGLNPNVKLKDSGVDGIGKMPEHWFIKRVKDCFSVIAGATPKSDQPEFWDGEIIWVTPADFKTEDHYVSRSRKSITKAGYDSCSTVIVPQGSLIFSKRAPVGTVAISSTSMCTNQGCLSCTPRPTCSSNFFYYLFSISTSLFEVLSNGSTFLEISASSFSNMLFQCPPFSEQCEIASYLDAECAKIDAASKLVEKQIDAYRRLKRSLINEVITGKRPVA